MGAAVLAAATPLVIAYLGHTRSKGAGATPSAQPLARSGVALAAEASTGEALPGAPAFPPELTARLRARWAARDPSYEPRTRHLRQGGAPTYTNRLFLESSPYLLQHAHNPVNWYPWGDEAFETARRHGRPVLLSVGYSTCHWCHVMEEESFDDEEIARFLNENYVIVKVDPKSGPTWTLYT